VGIDTTQFLMNFGALGVVLVLILSGILVPGFFYRKLERENEVYRDALSVERQRNSDLQQFAATGQKAIAALAQVAEERRDQRGALYDGTAPHEGSERAPLDSGR
jgi:hypothetical protein